MIVNLTANEIKILTEALDLWEKEALSGAMMSSMIGSIFAPKDMPRDEVKSQMEREMNEATKKADSRRDTKILIQAKLIQAANRELEHCDTPNPMH